MREELDSYLCQTYPKLFVNRNKHMTETCMFWGFECGDGWFSILNMLCQNIQHHIDWQNKKEQTVEQVVVDQVKEKFGTLRFYYTGGDDHIRGLVRMAESMSGVTCEDCGNPGQTGGEGWIRTICAPCEDKREAQRAQYMKDNGLEE
jgi:hypothetical protein